MVSDKYYKIFRWYVIGLSILLIILYGLFHFITIFKNHQTSFNIGASILIISILSIVYCFTGFDKIGKKFNYWQAGLASVLFIDFELLILLHHASQTGFYVFTIIWFIQAATSGIFGYPTVILFNFLTLTFIYLTSSITNKNMLVLLIGSVALSSAAQLLFWKNLQSKVFSKSNRSQTVDPLTGVSLDIKSEAENIIDSINEGIFLIDSNYKITLFNPTAEKITEWLADDAENIDVNLVVKVIQESGQPFSDQTNPFNQVIKAQNKVDIIAQLVSKSGKQTFISLIASPIFDNKKLKGAAFTMRDISTQRAAEQQKMEFISTASHEMRTPVAAIEGYLSLAMNDKISSIDAKAREYLEKAHSSTQQLGKLFQDLLNSAKAEDGRLVNHPEVIEMGDYISKLAEGFQLAAQKKHLIVNFTLMGSTDQKDTVGKVITPLFYIYADPNRLQEVLTNIFDNAVKYTDTGTITIGLGGDGSAVSVFIRDTGPGIPAENIPHLFQKFYRVDNSAVRTIGGTGLGLYISKKIVELYNGKIWAESEVGKGTTFYISIPRLTQQQADTMKASQVSQEQINMPTSNLTI